MTITAFGRLAHLYHQRMLRLFSTGNLFEMIEDPAIAQSEEFRAEAWKVAQGMARQMAHENAKSWRTAAMKSTRARQIYQALQAELRHGELDTEINRIAARNAELITSLPGEISRRVTSEAARIRQAGGRAAEVSREIRSLSQTLAQSLAKSRIQLIARTEISRAETDLTRARAEKIGIDWYVWQTSEDQRVRTSHRNMDQVLVAWNDPPQPEELVGEKSKLGHYHCGQAPNCRCVSLPLADLDEVKWPAKVYRMGRIDRMSRAEFTRVIGAKIAA